MQVRAQRRSHQPVHPKKLQPHRPTRGNLEIRELPQDILARPRLHLALSHPCDGLQEQELPVALGRPRLCGQFCCPLLGHYSHPPLLLSLPLEYELGAVVHRHRSGHSDMLSGLWTELADKLVGSQRVFGG